MKMKMKIILVKIHTRMSLILQDLVRLISMLILDTIESNDLNVIQDAEDVKIELEGDKGKFIYAF
jgi:hypothetical protein